MIAQSWERALTRIESWLRWEGSSVTLAATPDDDVEFS